MGGDGMQSGQRLEQTDAAVREEAPVRGRPGPGEGGPQTEMCWPRAECGSSGRVQVVAEALEGRVGAELELAAGVAPGLAAVPEVDVAEP